MAERVHRRKSPMVTARFEAQSDLLVPVASMLSLTSDGFVAARAIAPPEQVGATTTIPLRAYDAGLGGQHRFLRAGARNWRRHK